MASTRHLILIFLFFAGLLAIGQEKKKDSEVSQIRSVENKISFKENLNSNKLEYKLEPVADGHFKLIFINRPTEYVRIQIYDIIGNLILSEDNKYYLNSEIEYNFNEKNNKIYVVKVEAGDDNLTKKVNF